MSHRTRRPVFLLSLVAAVLVAQPALAAPKKGKRHGIEGRIVRFDDAKDQLVVNVSKTKVSGGAGIGRVAGEPAPSSVRRGEELVFAVVPEGSVLRRTVVKSIQGGGLNNAGTRESFLAALAAIPEDRDVIFSFEKNPKGPPEYVLKMIQIRMTEEELEARLEEISVEE
jgi:hypothetical protein